MTRTYATLALATLCATAALCPAGAAAIGDDNLSKIKYDASRVTAEYSTIALYALPDETSEIVGVVKEGEVAEIIDGRAVYTTVYTSRDVAKDYVAWFKLRADGCEGWTGKEIHSEYTGGTFVGTDSWGTYVGTEFLVRFGEAFSPLREAPSKDAPPVKPIEDENGDSGRHFDRDWGITPDVEAGRLYSLRAYCDGWYCVGNSEGGAWVPADAKGLEIYSACYGVDTEGSWVPEVYNPDEDTNDRTYYVGTEVHRSPVNIGTIDENGCRVTNRMPIAALDGGEGEFFINTNRMLYFLPVTDDVERVFYVEPTMMGYGYLTLLEPELVIATDKGDVTAEYVGLTYRPYGIQYQEFALPGPLPMDEINGFSLSTKSRLDESAERVTMDPSWYYRLGQ